MFPASPFDIFTVANKMSTSIAKEIGFHPDDQYREREEKQCVPPGYNYIEPDILAY